MSPIPLSESVRSRLPVPLAMLAMAVIAMLPVTPALAVAASAGIVLLPGASLLALLGADIEAGVRRTATAGAAGLGIVMAAGLAASVIGPLLGVARPLDPAPLRLVLLSVAGVLAAFGAVTGRDGLRYITDGTSSRTAWWSAALAVLPVLAVLGGLRLTATGQGDLATAAMALSVLAVLAVAAVAAKWPDKAPAVPVLFFAVLAVAFATTSRGTALYGWDIQKELSVALDAMSRGIFTPPADGDAYASMLSLTVIPAALRAVAGIDAEAVLRYAFPVFLAASVVIGYTVTRRFAPPAVALTVIAATSFASGALARGLPAIAREEAGLFAAMVMLAVLTDTTLSLRARRVLLVALAAILAVSHYTSAYMMAGILGVAWLFSGAVSLARPVAFRPPRVVSVPVLAAVIILTVGWNAGVTNSVSAFTKPLYFMDSAGLNLLPDLGANPVGAWLRGGSPDTVPVADYRAALAAAAAGDGYRWLAPAAGSGSVPLADAAAPETSGPLAAAGPVWSVTSRLASQGLLVLITLAVLLGIARALRRRRDLEPDVADEPSSELAGVGLGALAVVILLRLSASAAASYNPERAALHAALLYAPLLAVGLALLIGRRRRLAVAAAGALLSIVLLASTGLGSAFFSGPSAGSLSATGEEAERFVIPAQAHSAAAYLADVTGTWLAAHPGAYPLLVQEDRYAAVDLLVEERANAFHWLDWIDPAAVDRNAFVYASASNLATGRARGLIGQKRAVFTFPAAFFDATRSVVYSDGTTKVWR